MKRFIYFVLFSVLLISCQKNDYDIDEDYNNDYINYENIKRTILIYAVNKSSLSYDFTSDSSEILRAASKIDLSKYQILVYRTDSDTSCGLYYVKPSLNGGSPTFAMIREYERNTTSTAPQRIKEVIDYALTLFPNSKYDLIFWGHGMSWKPYFTNHEISIPSEYAYGGEYNGSISDDNRKETDWIEIDELADCVPDNIFDTIWFDSCYMTGIEVIYEFRDKCKTFVGYPTEVWSYGLAYDLVLPYLLSEEHDVKEAAKVFFNDYNVSNDPVTVAVLDMAKLEPVADISRKIIQSGELLPNKSELINYCRTGEFYDLRQLFSKRAITNDASELAVELKKVLDDFTIYHAESARDFNFHFWDTTQLSGISTHYYTGSLERDEEYYRTLDWFKRVYL